MIVVAGTEGVSQPSPAEKEDPEEMQWTSDSRPLQVTTSKLFRFKEYFHQSMFTAVVYE